MNKLLVRLLVAFLAFSLSLVLTDFKRFLIGDSSAPLIPPNIIALPVPSNADKLQICALYSQYGPAETQHDRAFFERVETEDFRLIAGDDQFTREEDLQWMEQQPRDTVYEVRVDHLALFQNSAVAHGVFEIRYGNGEVEESPFMDTWVKDGTVWRIQSTRQTDDSDSRRVRSSLPCSSITH